MRPMPELIEYSEHAADRFFPKHITDKVLGMEEGKRSTKSWIPSLELALALTALEEFGGKLRAKLRKMEDRRFDLANVPQRDRRYRDWSGPARYEAFHRKALEHFISHDGHSLKFAVRHEQLRQAAEVLAKESAQAPTKADG